MNLNLESFIGQDNTKNNLKVFINSALKRGVHLDHTLIDGPAGLGKTTLAKIIANELNVDIKMTNATVLDKVGDIAGILASLEEKDVLFIDEIHRLNINVEEFIYSAMEDNRIDIVVDKGVQARTISLKINPFTLIGATTKSGKLSLPLRSRFGITLHLDFYKKEDINEIVVINAESLNFSIEEEASLELSSRSRGVPRIAKYLLKRVIDFAVIRNSNTITLNDVKSCFNALKIDNKGLDSLDLKYLKCLVEYFNGGPAGINNIASSLNIDYITLEEVCEPFLLKEGLIKRTNKGRIITHLGYKHLNILPPRIKKNSGNNDTGFLI